MPKIHHRRRAARAVRAALAVLVACLAAALWLPGSVSRADAATPPLTVVVMGGLGSTVNDYPSIVNVLTGKGYAVKVFSPAHGGWQWDAARNDDKKDPATGKQIQERIDVMTAEFTSWVTASVASPKLALVPHSAGGLIARNYIKKVDRGARVEKIVMTGVANYGTQLDSKGSDYEVGSSFLSALNSGDVSIGSIGYWSFTSSVDNIVFPYENQQLPRTSGTTSTQLSYPYVKHPIPGVLPDPQVTNLIIQEQCPWALIPHIGMTATTPVQSAILQALQGSRSITVTC